MDTHKLNKKQYYFIDDIKESHPKLFKGCKTVRNFVTRHKIPDNRFAYAKLTKKKWHISDGSSKKFDKLFISQKWFDQKFLVNEEYEEELIDDIQDAPPLIYLEDHEKFINNKGEYVEIEVRGDREYNECYFRVKDIMDGFELKNLHIIILDPKGNYTPSVHYQYFYSEKLRNSDNFRKKKMYLTYKGLLKVVFGSRSKSTAKFVDWATEVLFIAHLGTAQQKTQLISNLQGVSTDAVKQVFNKNAHKMPCIYLFSVGRVEDLREELGIDDSYSDNDYVYKWGRTEDFERRTKEHTKSYGKLNGSNLEMITFGFIDPQYVSQAETKLKNMFDGMDMVLKHDDYKELAIIPKKKIKLIKEQYETISKAYLGHVTELVQKLKEKDNEIVLLTEKYENKLLKEQHKNELLKEKYELQKERYENKLLKKDLEIATLKLSKK